MQVADYQWAVLIAVAIITAWLFILQYSKHNKLIIKEHCVIFNMTCKNMVQVETFKKWPPISSKLQEAYF